MLAVRFAGTFALGLVVVGWWTHAGTTRLLRRQLDQSLRGAALLAADRFRTDTGPVAVESFLDRDRERYGDLINRYLILRDSAGRVIRSVPGFAADLPVDTGALRRARAGESAYVDGSWNHSGLREIFIPVATPGAPGEVVQVAASTAPLDAWVRSDLALLVGVVIALSALTFWGAGRLATSAVRPVREITDHAALVAAGTLDRRITAHADVEEFGGLVSVLNEMFDRLERAFEAQRRFVADVSHELRSPLAALQGEVEVALRKERSPDQYRATLRSALEETERLTALVGDLLWLTRVRGGLELPRRAAVDPNAVAREAVTRAGLLGGAPVRIQADFRHPGTATAMDPQLVGRVLDALIHNAVRYAPEGPISVTTDARDGGAAYVVEDRGPGVAAADLPHVFDPFYRADEARTRGDGMGLGLTVAATIARMHDGTLTASNRAGGGARFELFLPG